MDCIQFYSRSAPPCERTSPELLSVGTCLGTVNLELLVHKPEWLLFFGSDEDQTAVTFFLSSSYAYFFSECPHSPILNVHHHNTVNNSFSTMQ